MPGAQRARVRGRGVETVRSKKTSRVALLGLLFALTAVLSFLESLLLPFLGLPPGVKPGLANTVVMFALLFLDRRSALILVLLKSLFVLVCRGAVAGLLSCSGGLLSLGVMLLLCGRKSSRFILSVSGAIAHNFGQLLAMRLLLRSAYTLYYLPVLLVSGLVMGAATAGCLRAILPALEKLGLAQTGESFRSS